MARRSLSTKDIREGMAYIYEKLVDQKLSAREVANDPNLPFSLTTYYKYLPKYGKQLLKSAKPNSDMIVSEDERETTTKAFSNSRNEMLVAQNQELLDEINRLNRFIVQKFITNDKGSTNEGNNANSGVH